MRLAFYYAKIKNISFPLLTTIAAAFIEAAVALAFAAAPTNPRPKN